MILAAEFVIFALYACVIVAFLRVFYFQIRLIAQIWALIYATFGIRIWRVLSDRTAFKTAYRAWRNTAPVLALKARVLRAWVHLGLCFGVFCAVITLLALTLPSALERGLFAL